MRFSIRAFIAVLIVLPTGCQTGREFANAVAQTTDGADHIACLTHYYTGNFGSGEKAWRGAFYLKENLSIVAHLPTRSEFYIRVLELLPKEKGLNTTNLLQGVADTIRDKAKGGLPTDSWEVIKHEIGPPLGTKGSYRRVEKIYLRRDFVRFDTDRYSRDDRVQITAHITRLANSQRSPENPLCFMAVAMIPVAVPDEERQRLLAILRVFLESVTLYQD